MKERIQKFDPRKNMNRPDFEVFHYRGSIPEEKEVHHHDFYEIFFLLGGKVAYWAEGQTYNLKPGDLLLINPMVLHRPMPESENTVYERIVLWINKAYLDHISEEGTRLSDCFNNAALHNTNLLHFDRSQKTHLTAKLDGLVQESYSGEFGSHIYAKGILQQFMVELNRFSFNSQIKRSDIKESSLLVSRVLDYIGEHYSEELSLDKLASEFFVSKYHLSHEFSREMGTGVYRYIMLKRLMVAKQLIFEGVSATDACALCGFKDYTNFYRAFKAEYGMSPAEVSSV